MRRAPAWYGLACGAAVAVACAAEVGESRDVPSNSAQQAASLVDGDALTALLAAVRVDDALLCTFAVERIDQRGHWGRWDFTNDELLEGDSATAAVLSYLERSPGAAADVPRLAAAMRDENRCVRRVAASLLSRVDDPSAVSAVGAALADARPEVRALGALTAGMSESPAHASALERLLSDADANVRHASAWALGATEGRASLSRLLELLARDPEPRVRQAAAWAVGRIASS